jgi:hypothetical protein
MIPGPLWVPYVGSVCCGGIVAGLVDAGGAVVFGTEGGVAGLLELIGPVAPNEPPYDAGLVVAIGEPLAFVVIRDVPFELTLDVPGMPWY